VKDLAQALFEEAGDALFLFDPDTDQLQPETARPHDRSGQRRTGGAGGTGRGVV
jgi:hypothetical protein